MNLWDYRQALYADAAKWVCGDVGKPRGKQSVAEDIDEAQRMANYHAGYTPGSYAGIGYRIAYPRNQHLGWGQ